MSLLKTLYKSYGQGSNMTVKQIEESIMDDICEDMAATGAYFPSTDDIKDLKGLGWKVCEQWHSCVSDSDGIDVLCITSPSGLCWSF
jgi:hypothetical protein